jgi:phosphoribosylanthranilate isomerase
MKNDTLLRCTFTGVDEQSSFEEIKKLSIEFPFVEWGVLLSTSENSPFSKNRYPSLDWLKENLPKLKNIAVDSGSSIALHVCGKETKELLAQNENSIALSLLPFVNRVQINFLYKEHQVEQLENLCQKFPHINFITQHNNRNAELHKKIFSLNHQILFDQSGGRGIETTEWESPLENKICGYAGGLGPNNIIKQLSLIKNVANRPFWIDMEGKIRTNDILDLNLCKEILYKVSLVAFNHHFTSIKKFS